MNGTKALVLATAAAVVMLVSTAHAQLAYRSASSAFISGSGGTPTAPSFRSYSTAILVGGGNATKRLYLLPITAEADPPTLRGNWADGGTTTYTKVQLSPAIRPMSGSGTSGGAARTSTTANPGHVLVTRFASDPIPVAQTISGTLNWVVGAAE